MVSDSSPISPPPPRHLILGTAGHIDHGKSSLIRALTGTDTDRLPEEKRRGMTIELGFAELPLNGVHYGIVDVPGHERFVRTMVAGAMGIDVALLVVAADDSVMPQTIEHVEILELMGINRAVVAITKCDAVDDTMIDLVEEEVRELLSDTPLGDSPIVRVSSVTGDGLHTLKTRLREVGLGVGGRRTGGPFRMAIDRCFSVTGRGTVVTGSVLSGTVSTGDTLEVHPGGRECRARDTQSHGQNLSLIESGRRAAVNLIGIDRTRIQRGHEISTPGYITPSRRIDVALRLLGSNRRPLKNSTLVRVCMGTGDVPARVVSLDYQDMAAGAKAYAQLRTSEPFLATYGQRFILREENDSRTIGGGVVLRPVAGRWPRDREQERVRLNRLESIHGDDVLEQVFSDLGFETISPLKLSARSGIDPWAADASIDRLANDRGWIWLTGLARPVRPDVIDRLFDRADAWIGRYHAANPDEPGCPMDAVIGWFERRSAQGLGRALYDRYLDDHRADVRGRFVCSPTFTTRLSLQDSKILACAVEAIGQSAFQPPSPDEIAKTCNADGKRLRKLLRLAVSDGRLVDIDGSIFLTTDLEVQMKKTVTEMIHLGDAVTVGGLRERLNSSRKYVVPYLEYLDRIGFTVRQGDVRVLGEEVAT